MPQNKKQRKRSDNVRLKTACSLILRHAVQYRDFCVMDFNFHFPTGQALNKLVADGTLADLGNGNYALRKSVTLSPMSPDEYNILKRGRRCDICGRYSTGTTEVELTVGDESESINVCPDDLGDVYQKLMKTMGIEDIIDEEDEEEEDEE